MVNGKVEEDLRAIVISSTYLFCFAGISLLVKEFGADSIAIGIEDEHCFNGGIFNSQLRRE